MDWASLTGQTAAHSTASGIMDNNMDMESIQMSKTNNYMENGKMERKLKISLNKNLMMV